MTVLLTFEKYHHVEGAADTYADVKIEAGERQRETQNLLDGQTEMGFYRETAHEEESEMKAGDSEIYRCEWECGFEGSYHQVTSHESVCIHEGGGLMAERETKVEAREEAP